MLFRSDDLMQVDFGYQINTDNILDKGVSVVLYPTEALEVKANDEPVSINRVEYRADGKFYIVLDDVLDMNANVTVSFKNPVADADNAMKYDDVLAPINPEEAYQGYVLDFSAETADFDDSF